MPITARTKLLTSATYSPTNPASEAAIRSQIDGSVQEVYDIATTEFTPLGTTVNLTGNQTIADVKTFSSSPIVPTPTTSTQVATKGYVDSTIVAVSVPNDSLTETQMSASYKKQAGGVAPYDDAILKTLVTAANDFIVGTGVGTVDNKTLAETKTILGLDAEYAKFKSGNSTYTDNDTSQTFTDAFCTSSSLVTIAITSVTKPQGVWSVTSGTGDFTITSTVAESADITFDYYIQKVV